jgi:hypothetical protein
MLHSYRMDLARIRGVEYQLLPLEQDKDRLFHVNHNSQASAYLVLLSLIHL